MHDSDDDLISQPTLKENKAVSNKKKTVKNKDPEEPKQKKRSKDESESKSNKRKINEKPVQDSSKKASKMKLQPKGTNKDDEIEQVDETPQDKLILQTKKNNTNPRKKSQPDDREKSDLEIATPIVESQKAEKNNENIEVSASVAIEDLEKELDAPIDQEVTKYKTLYSELQKDYQKLVNVGIKQAEKTFKDYCDAAETRYQGYEDVIVGLKAEVTNLKTEVQEKKLENKQLQTQISASSEHERKAKATKIEMDNMRKEIELLTAKNQEISAILQENNEKIANDPSTSVVQEFYQRLTGLSVESVEKTETEVAFTCQHQGQKKSLEFKISIPEAGPCNYTFLKHDPMISESDNIVTQDLEFEAEMLQRFFLNQLEYLCKDS